MIWIVCFKSGKLFSIARLCKRASGLRIRNKNFFILGFKKIYVSSFSSLEGLDSELSKLPGQKTAGSDSSKSLSQKGHGIQVIKVADVPALCRTLFKS